ncbi:MAG: hypothetical protein ACREIC_03970, partial [Limisphaerales bacterium]
SWWDPPLRRTATASRVIAERDRIFINSISVAETRRPSGQISAGYVLLEHRRDLRRAGTRHGV